MLDGKSVLTIIPARGGSKGLPGKNTIELYGRPLVGWPIKAAKNFQYVDRVIVSTDDEKIARIAQEQGTEVPFMSPAELATDTSITISALKHTIHYLKSEGATYDYCVLL